VQEALRVIGAHLPEWAPQPYRTREDRQDAHQDAGAGNDDEGVASGADSPSQAGYISLADIAIDGALLRGAHLTGLNLRRSQMRDVRLEYSDLSNARLRRAVLSDADFEGAILLGTSFAYATLIRADLRDADLRGADLRHTKLTGVQLAGAKLEGAHLWAADGIPDRLGLTSGKPHCLPKGPKCRGQSAQSGQS